MSCVGRLDVVSVSLDVAKMSVLAPSVESGAIDVTHNLGSRYGVRIGDLRSKSVILRSPNPKKHPKNQFLRLRNSDLRR